MSGWVMLFTVLRFRLKARTSLEKECVNRIANYEKAKEFYGKLNEP